MVPHRTGKAAVTMIIVAAFAGAIVAAESIKRLFYEVRVVTGSLAETQAYYGTTRAPATLDEWMQKYNFSARSPGETIDQYRQRVGIVVYANRNELGLGRELGCSNFSDVAPSGQTQPGIACFVTNYGERFKNEDKALADAVAGKNPKDTFVIVYAPLSSPAPSSLGNGVVPTTSYAVNFWAFDGPSGRRQDWAALDEMGPRAVPGICTNCHGGTYDLGDHLLIGGQFQPINPSILTFSTMPGYTLADQQARIAALNALTAPGCIKGAQSQLPAN